MHPGPPHSTPLALQPPSSHYENFPVASVLCPPRLRPAIAAIYWFARTADDIADEGDARPAQRLKDLSAIRDDLLAAAEGRPGSGRWPHVFDALQPVIAEFDLPVPLLADLLSAFEQDVVKQRYATEAELLDYCRRSADPVGRLLLHLYGVYDAESLGQSDHICSALQLINFWQDLSVDIPRGRIYLPRELWAAHGVDEAQLMAHVINPATTNLIAACARAARARMLKGLELPASVSRRLGGFDGWRAALELRCVIQGGLRILDKMAAMDHRTLARRPKLTAWDAVVIFWKALLP
ncbi:squalene synthase HpnC [Polaromonas eurypsychrophila]|uniref:Squalene synthase HpnC n=1 Tax=Polaromonas eurypsychrophila TaxID=1614635 RepID=A0A916SJ91_9BURK|nr:squalene synthase HpnC [Polaromonas eurypsychrophila]GGB00348.1 squalene synthase HpnC [Polaromonas eurypsychrophila]